MAFLLSKPESWKINVDELNDSSPAGKHAVRRIMKELCGYGYLKRSQSRNKKGHLVGWVFTIEYPPFPVNSEIQDDRKPISLKSVEIEKEEPKEEPKEEEPSEELFTLTNDEHMPKKAPKPDDELLIALAKAYRPNGTIIPPRARKLWKEVRPDPDEVKLVIDYVTAWKQGRILDGHDLSRYCTRAIETCLSQFGKQLSRAEEWAKNPQAVEPPRSLRMERKDKCAGF